MFFLTRKRNIAFLFYFYSENIFELGRDYMHPRLHNVHHMEHKVNPDFGGPLKIQISTILWFAFSSLFYGHSKYKCANNEKYITFLFVILKAKTD